MAAVGTSTATGDDGGIDDVAMDIEAAATAVSGIHARGLRRRLLAIRRTLISADRENLRARHDAGTKLLTLLARSRHGDGFLAACATVLELDEGTLRDYVRIAAAWPGAHGRSLISRTNCRGEVLPMRLLLRIAQVRSEDERNALAKLALEDGLDLDELEATMLARRSHQKMLRG
jgi:hypothetical protein